MIKLNITKMAENPDYNEENAKFANSHYWNCSSEPKMIEESALSVGITEEQFDAIRKEVLKNF